MKCWQCVTLGTTVCEKRIIKITVFWVNLSWNSADKAVSHEAMIVVKFDSQISTFVC